MIKDLAEGEKIEMVCIKLMIQQCWLLINSEEQFNVSNRLMVWTTKDRDPITRDKKDM